ncbi:glycosyltransferase family 32 protein [Collinsella intestinalis]|uniref:glycosyltransferase family 32 protein n=1 Tax=Collinsella intestinalis TaxID=147207 RepID=UPI0026733AC4|nr:glycosyltransferase [Collinsella intestinalis]
MYRDAWTRGAELIFPTMKKKDAMIPKVIHYTWFGGKSLPRDVRRCMDSWMKHCPDYEIVKWDESNFDINCHPFCQKAYQQQKWAFVSDYARLKVIYENGGIYLDTDVELLRSLDDLLGLKCWVGIEQSAKLCATGLGFGAIPKSPAVERLMSEYDDEIFSEDLLAAMACPILNNRALLRMGYTYSNEIVDLGDITVYPPRYFDPIAPGGDSKNLLCDDSYSVHQYSNSWGSRSDVIRRKVIRLIGVKRIEAIKSILFGNK